MTEVRNIQVVLDKLLAEHAAVEAERAAAIKEGRKSKSGANGRVSGHSDPPAGPHEYDLDDDDALIEKAMSARNGGKFRALWNGSTAEHDSNASKADSALVFLLVFWCGPGNVADRVDRLFRRSDLMRDKWDERRGDNTYGELTIAKALDGKPDADRYRGRPVRGPKARFKGTKVGENGHHHDGGGGGDGPTDGGDGGSNDGTPSGPSSRRRRIVQNNRQLRDVATEAVAALVVANDPPRLFRNGNNLVELLPDCPAGADDDRPVNPVRPVEGDQLRNLLSDAADWIEEKENGRGEIETTDEFPHTGVVKAVLALGVWPAIPPLAGVVTVPVFTRSGSLLLTPGYDRASGYVYRPAKGLDVPTVQPRPTADEIDAARAALVDELFEEFPFVDDSSRAHAVALTLLPFCRAMIDGPTPLHHFDAPQEGTGKSLLVESATTVFLGRAADAIPEVKDPEEWRKMLLAYLIEARPFLFIDNLNRKVDAGPLASALTAEWVSGRLLGVTEVGTARNAAAWCSSGNNVKFSGEMIRRTLYGRLDKERETAWDPDRRYKRRLPRWAKENRSRLVHSCLTLIRAWVAADRPKGGKVLGKFEEWAETMGGILDVAGVPGFMGNLDKFRKSAADTQLAMTDFIEAWWSIHNARAVGVTDLYATGLECEVIELGPGKHAEHGARCSLGRLLSRNVDRVFEFGPKGARVKKKLVEAGEDHRRTAVYQLADPGPTPKPSNVNH